MTLLLIKGPDRIRELLESHCTFILTYRIIVSLVIVSCYIYELEVSVIARAERRAMSSPARRR